MPQKKGDRIQVSGKRRGLKFWLLTAAATSVILGILISALLPLGIQWGMKKTLVEFGAESVVVENIDFNAFKGRLVIFGLEFSGPEEGFLTVDRVVVDLDLIPAWKKRVKARYISVIGLAFDVIQLEDGDLVIGGFPLPAPVKGEKISGSEEKTGKPWGLGISSLDFNDINVRLSAFGVKEMITLDRAQLSELHTWNIGKTGQTDISFMFNGGLVQIIGEAEPLDDKPGVMIQLNVGGMPLDWTVPYLTSEITRREVGKQPLQQLFPQLRKYDIGTINGELWVRSKLNLLYDPGTGNRTVSAKSSLTLKNLDVTANLASIPVRYREKQFVVDSTFEYRDDGTFDLDNIRLAGASTIEEMRLDSTESGRNILSVDLYRLSGFKATGAGFTEAEGVHLKGVRVLEEESESHAISFGEITVRDIRFSDLNRIEVAEIDMKGVDNLVALDSEGDINLIRSLEQILPESEMVAEEGQNESDPPGSPVTFRIDRISVSDGSRIRVHDASVTPSIELTFSPLEVEITGLDSADPDNPASLTLASKFGKHSDLDVRGTIKPFSVKPTMDLKATVRSLELPPLTPYSKKNIGYLIKSGRLDADVDWRIDQGIIDSQVSLVLHRFLPVPVDESDEEAFSKKLDIPVPVNMALSLLQDQNDDIHLELPIEGNIEDPDFQIDSVIARSVGKAMTTGAVGYFAPLGFKLALNVVLLPVTTIDEGASIDTGRKSRFDPVQFSPLEDQLNTENKGYLDKVYQLIEDRPNIELVLCGISTTRDLLALRKPVAEKADSDQDESEGQMADTDAALEMPITPEERSILQEIAKKRALAVENYLLDRGLHPTRLIVCFSEFEDKKDALPRVDVTL